MRSFINCLIVIVMLSGTGCAFFEHQDPAEQKFIIKKQDLEREIELLRLERRKILLQNSLDELDAQLPGTDEPK